MRAAPFVPHQTSAELEHAYRTAQRPVERSRWQILWLKSKGKSIAEIMEATGYSRSTISVLISKYNAGGPDAVRDKRQDNRSEPALNIEQQKKLAQILAEAPPTGGIWTSAKVQEYVREHFNVHITQPCAWGYLKRL